jgi:hypothetical protein
VALRGMEVPLHSLSTCMELEGQGRGASNRVRWQLQSVGCLAAHLTRRIPRRRGRLAAWIGGGTAGDVGRWRRAEVGGDVG